MRISTASVADPDLVRSKIFQNFPWKFQNIKFLRLLKHPVEILQRNSTPKIFWIWTNYFGSTTLATDPDPHDWPFTQRCEPGQPWGRGPGLPGGRGRHLVHPAPRLCSPLHAGQLGYSQVTAYMQIIVHVASVVWRQYTVGTSLISSDYWQSCVACKCSLRFIRYLTPCTVSVHLSAILNQLNLDQRRRQQEWSLDWPHKEIRYLEWYRDFLMTIWRQHFFGVANVAKIRTPSPPPLLPHVDSLPDVLSAT